MAKKSKAPAGAKDRVIWSAVRLDVAAAADETANKPTWIQAAYEGQWKGYGNLPLVEFTRQTFETIIKNFRANPSFKAGEGGIGTEPVVPLDYEHASEADPTSGSIPQAGAPAPGWILDLQIRNAADGTAELWALVTFGEQLRQQIKAGEYRWTSVSVWLHYQDPESGKDVGPTLTSLAVTNKPFLKGMAPMIAASVWVAGQAESPAEAFIGLRDIFGLEPEATPDDVLREVTDFVTQAGAGTLPPWVEPDYVWSSLRNLLGLRLLAGPDEILAEVGNQLGGLSNQTGTASRQTTEPAPMNAPAANPAALTVRLSKLFKSRDTDESICMAAEQAVESQNALDAIAALLGSKDTQGLVKQATEMVNKAKQLEPLIAALAAANEQVGNQADAEAEAEVEAVAASMGWDEATKKRVQPLLLSQRKACIVRGDLARFDDPKLMATRIDADKLAAFRKDWPLPEAAKATLTALLTKSTFAGPGGVQLGGAATGAPQTAPLGTPPAGGPPAANHLEEIKKFSGPNPVAQAIACLKEKQKETFTKLSFRAQNFVAGQYLKTGVYDPNVSIG